MAYPALKERISLWATLARPTAVVIEDKASGQSVIQDLKLSTSLPIVAMPTDGDKVTRAHTIAPTYEAGVILLPEGAPWLGEFLDELHAFPKAAHDDQVDAFVQGVRWLLHPVRGAGILEHYRQEVEALMARQTAPLDRKSAGGY